MPTTQRARQPATEAKRAPGRVSTTDAVALLKADHKKVGALFEQYGKGRSAAKKQDIVATICRELSVHAMVEEEIFYPAGKAALKDMELVPEAHVEHATLKEFMAKVDGRLPRWGDVRRRSPGHGRVRQAPREGGADGSVPQGAKVQTRLGGARPTHAGAQGRTSCVPWTDSERAQRPGRSAGPRRGVTHLPPGGEGEVDVGEACNSMRQLP